MTPPTAITVHGLPQPGGSKKAFMKPGMRYPVVVDANPKAASWKQDIARECALQYGGPLLDGPLEVEVHFYRPRPKGHFSARGALKDSAPLYPTVAPDVDKLSRLILDGLTGQLWRDDAQVVRKVAEKHYGEPARAEIVCTPLRHRTVGEDAEQLSLVAA